MAVDWLYFRWWQDASGRAWIWHNCNGNERIEPLPTSVWRVVDGGIQPSIDCRECGKHIHAGPADRCEPPAIWTDPSVPLILKGPTDAQLHAALQLAMAALERVRDQAIEAGVTGEPLAFRRIAAAAEAAFISARELVKT